MVNRGVRQRVVFLGSEEAERDAVFAKAQDSLSRMAMARRASAQIEHLLVPHHLSWTRKQALVAEALDQGCELLLAPTANTALLAANEVRRAYRPQSPALLFVSFMDPVGMGIVLAPPMPRGRITGITLVDTWHGKRFEILRRAFGHVGKVGILKDRPWGSQEALEREIVFPATQLGLRTVQFDADTVEELNLVMRSAAAAQMDAWYVVDSYLSWLAEKQIIEHLNRLQRPAMHTTVNEVAKSGALMAYAADRTFVYDTLADLTLRVLAGEDPGSIPIQRPRRFVLAVRPRAEPAALRIHPAVVRRADLIF
jgi:ABC transporter substrate binding protein